MSKVIEGLYYTDSHEWVKVEGEYAYIGITDFAQHQLGNIVYVDIPEVGDEIKKEEEFGAVESVKAASDLLSPVSGTIVEVNEKLSDEPELINQDAFDSWMLKIKLSDPGELNSLMDSQAYDSSPTSLTECLIVLFLKEFQIVVIENKVHILENIIFVFLGLYFICKFQ